MPASQRDKEELRVRRKAVYESYLRLLRQGIPATTAHSMLSLEHRVSANTIRNYIRDARMGK